MRGRIVGEVGEGRGVVCGVAWSSGEGVVDVTGNFWARTQTGLGEWRAHGIGGAC
jgi:hypothetical protein